MTSTEQKFYTVLLSIEDKLIKIEEMIKAWEKDLKKEEKKTEKKTVKSTKTKRKTKTKT